MKFKEDDTWKLIDGLDNFYAISINGEIKSLDRIVHCKNGTIRPREGKKIKTRVNRYGYEQIALGKERKNFLVHRIVAQAFIPNNLNKPCVNHINGIKTDNFVKNIEWCTYWENDNHSRKTGLYVCKLQGENGSNVKLTNELVFKIREMHNSNKYSQREIGRILNIEYKNINQIILRKRWKHI